MPPEAAISTSVSDAVTPHDVVFLPESNPKKVDDASSDRRDRNVKIAFLGGVTALGLLSGFGSAVAMAKKRDPTSFAKGITPGAVERSMESGGALALRALGWGTFFAVGGVGLLCFTVYKLLDVQNPGDFRRKMSEIVPKMPMKPADPSARTEFASIREFFEYISEKRRDKWRCFFFQFSHTNCFFVQWNRIEGW